MTSMPVHALSVAHFVCMWGIYTNLSCLPQYYIQILAMNIDNVSCFMLHYFHYCNASTFAICVFSQYLLT